MTGLVNKLLSSPTLTRVLPFMIFLALTYGQGKFGDTSRYWFYLAKTVVGLWMLWSLRGLIEEMKWVLSWEGAVVGVGVFVFWVGLDGFYPSLADVYQKFICPLWQRLGLAKCAPANAAAAEVWNPHAAFGANTTLAWWFIAVRLFGSAVVVPPMEEVVFRSWLYRYLVKPDFQSVPVGGFFVSAFLWTSVIFGFEHHEWLPGILCGFAYQGLVCWKKRLGDAITAHAITNLLLGLWVVGRGAWKFW